MLRRMNDAVSHSPVGYVRNRTSARGTVRLGTLPTAEGGITRAAYSRVIQAGVDVRPLLKRAGLTLAQVKNPDLRLPVRVQIRFLNLVADALQTEFLGVALAFDIDLRKLGLLYYVGASSETLGDALRRLARYSTIQNEGVRITYREAGAILIAFEYVGVARWSDRHQIEFFVTILLRACRQITGSKLSPRAVKLVHRRPALPARFASLLGSGVEFGSKVDQIELALPAREMPLVNADPFLNSLLLKYCDQALADRDAAGRWRTAVENAIVPLLPHGQAGMSEVARRLGLGRQTLARRLAAEGCTFSGVLDELRSRLARRYLRERNLPISQIAWLLGYQETSAFNHAFRRWTGRTPKQERSASGGSDDRGFSRAPR